MNGYEQPVAADPLHRARREAEVRALLTGLEAELADWKQAARERGPLEKHQSQIESAVRVVTGALDRLKALPAPERHAKAPELVLDLHHLWDFFRTKLAVRHIPRCRRILDVADELAWAVYDPVRQAAADRLALREPPLTFPSRHPVPFATARGSDFEELLPSGRQRTLAGRRATRHLPFPVIGIPWSAGHHLPSLLAVAHETGHHIEDDFGLAEPLRTRLRERAGLPADRVAVWEQWLGEVFADVCGALACGAAYLWTLADALAADPDADGGLRDYPPPRLRLLVCRSALAGPGTSTLPLLPGTAGPDDVEAPAVVRALVGDAFEELGGATLASLVGLRRPAELEEARLRLCAGLRSGRSDVPGVLAAATLAFVGDPDEYDRKSLGERALREVLSLVPQERRAASAAEQVLAARDHATGSDLFDLLTTSR
ncbi:hypothetical protein [Streptomyces sp. NPDC008137]|uniref:hypothetical protein n=1 Tax=Streptomyces sp. NPDC008137 TaxID=3364813 RepID=UPI0036E68326